MSDEENKGECPQEGKQKGDATNGKTGFEMLAKGGRVNFGPCQKGEQD
ncbi:MAG: hypothetical protein NVSMB49_19030 [Ktedonobacteraceae bacterium]